MNTEESELRLSLSRFLLTILWFFCFQQKLCVWDRFENDYTHTFSIHTYLIFKSHLGVISNLTQEILLCFIFHVSVHVLSVLNLRWMKKVDGSLLKYLKIFKLYLFCKRRSAETDNICYTCLFSFITSHAFRHSRNITSDHGYMQRWCLGIWFRGGFGNAG